MSLRGDQARGRRSGLRGLTQKWGSPAAVTLYLDRCQVDTPTDVVSKVWAHVSERRSRLRKVVDFGAGDGRFSRGGAYRQYVGYEIDTGRGSSAPLPKHATLIHRCAFSEEIRNADLCIGNPPYVRNQDLPVGWRQQAAASLVERTGVTLSGLANAWQYFFLLALASTSPDGLVAIVVPYEWVSRPSARILRDYIKTHNWDVNVYRLGDDTFDRVLTTSSITIVDKRASQGSWNFFSERADGRYKPLSTESGGTSGVIGYAARSAARRGRVYAKRGLSPGTQEVLTLTEGERVRSGLHSVSDVVPCVTTLRHLAPECESITEAVFKRHFRDAGRKCWLIRTDRPPSRRLRTYLDSVPLDTYQTATCLGRSRWWEFTMPQIPSLLAATGFHGLRPKIVTNAVGAHAVGGVCGIYGVRTTQKSATVRSFKELDLSKSIVSHSHGLKKLEINQFNTVLRDLRLTQTPSP